MMEFPSSKKNNNMKVIQTTDLTSTSRNVEFLEIFFFFFAISLILVHISKALVPYSWLFLL